MFEYVGIPICGFLIGCFVSIFGGGGGGLYAPCLIILFGVSPDIAISTSLAAVLPTTLSASYSHYKESNINFKLGLLLACCAIIGTLIGVGIDSFIPPYLLQKLLAILNVFFIISMSYNYFKRTKNSEDMEDKLEDKIDELVDESEEKFDDEIKEFVITKLAKLKAIGFGLLSGVMAGVFGISGSLPITTGLYSLGLKSRVVIGTTVFVLIFNSLAGIVGYYALGRLDIPIILLLAIGSIFGGFLGPRILNKIDSDNLEKRYPPFMIALMIVISICLFFG